MKTVALLLVSILTVANGFLPSQSQQLTHRRLGRNIPLPASSNENEDQVIVVGKVILDKYGDPQTQESDANVTIGGGGPQAAWGACASLAARDLILKREGGHWEPKMDIILEKPTPPKQSVTFLAPIGLKNWTPEMTQSLNELLPMIETSILVTSHEHITPTINIWHDEHEIVHWMPVNGSFGEEGADGLWRNRPSAQDILDAADDCGDNITLHAILESGDNPSGKGLDALPFFNSTLMSRVSTASIEPIVFPDDTGIVSHEDITEVRSLIKRVEQSLSDSCKSKNDKKLLVISPDRPCYDALFSNVDHAQINKQKSEFAVRDGASGSFVTDLIIPSAKLKTLDGTPINPTGAGNAYSGAYAACRASGSSIDAACLANAVGAVVCEYENLPPWSWDVLQRVAEAACEVRGKVQI
mmetsp:Transcript_24951/g.60067  ORF Transcript_24951/g.60067 Transcript_24951/m.60067 type:complete len:414 (-) Transcript_24951:966-2207(-)